MIRAARSSDAGRIAQIWNRVIRATTHTFTNVEKLREDVAAMIAGLDARDAFLVAEAGGQVQGFCLSGPFRAGPGYASVRETSIYLAENAQGRGLGRALFTRCEEELRARGAHVLVAAVSGENDVAQAFHAAMGFQKVGELPGIGEKFGRRIDLVLMQKNL